MQKGDIAKRRLPAIINNKDEPHSTVTTRFGHLQSARSVTLDKYTDKSSIPTLRQSSVSSGSISPNRRLLTPTNKDQQQQPKWEHSSPSRATTMKNSPTRSSQSEITPKRFSALLNNSRGIRSYTSDILMKPNYSESPRISPHHLSKTLTYSNLDNKYKTHSENFVKEEISPIVDVVTRPTSPTLPASSEYVRLRRAQVILTEQKTVLRTSLNVTLCDASTQTHKESKIANPTWTLQPSHNYTGYAGRYSTRSTCDSSSNSNETQSKLLLENNTSESSMSVNSNTKNEKSFPSKHTCDTSISYSHENHNGLSDKSLNSAENVESKSKSKKQSHIKKVWKGKDTEKLSEESTRPPSGRHSKNISSNSIKNSKRRSHSKNSDSECSELSSLSTSVSNSRASSVPDDDEMAPTSADEPSLVSEEVESLSRAKSFLTRTLPMIGNDVLTQSSADDIKWLESSSQSTSRDVNDIHTDSEKNFATFSSDILSTNGSKKNDINDFPHGNKFKKIQLVNSGERAWWLDNDDSSYIKNDRKLSKSTTNTSLSDQIEKSSSGKFDFFKIRHVASGQKDWWLSNDEDEFSSKEKKEDLCDKKNKNDTKSNGFNGCKHDWREQNKKHTCNNSSNKMSEFYMPSNYPLGDRESPEGLESDYQEETSRLVSMYGNVDEFLRSGAKIPYCSSTCEEVSANQVRIHDSSPRRPTIQRWQPRKYGPEDSVFHEESPENGWPELQNGIEQSYEEEFLTYDSLKDDAVEVEDMEDGDEQIVYLIENSRDEIPDVVARRIVERLSNARGQGLRRALFALKDILEVNPALAHAFVLEGGMEALAMQVQLSSSERGVPHALRAIGQLILRQDGMESALSGNAIAIRTMYARSIGGPAVRMALKFMTLVAEYRQPIGADRLVSIINEEDKINGRIPWHPLVSALHNTWDSEVTLLTMTLLNTILTRISDCQYRETIAALDSCGIKRAMELAAVAVGRGGAESEMFKQLKYYEAIRSFEDAETPERHLDETTLKQLKERKKHILSNEGEKHNHLKRPIQNKKINPDHIHKNILTIEEQNESNESEKENEFGISVKEETPELNFDHDIKKSKENRSFKCLTNSNGLLTNTLIIDDGVETSNNIILKNHLKNASDKRDNRKNAQMHTSQRMKLKKPLAEYIPIDFDSNSTNEDESSVPIVRNKFFAPRAQHARCLLELQGALEAVSNNTPDYQRYTTSLQQRIHNGTLGHSGSRNKLANIKENSPIESNPKSPSPVKQGFVERAKEELAKSVCKDKEKEEKNSAIEVTASLEQLAKERQLRIADIDFTDVLDEEYNDLLLSSAIAGTTTPAPPPPPLLPGLSSPRAPPLPAPTLSTEVHTKTLKSNKSRKTVKLFWRETPEVKCLPHSIKTVIWNDLPQVQINTSELEYLFEARTNDNLKKTEINKRPQILTTKRSNAINIGCKGLPDPRSLRNVVLKMDSAAIGREGVDKLLHLMPTAEEIAKIQEAQQNNPDFNLDSAEKFLMTLSTISDLEARLKLWAFKLDYENNEKDIVEPLNDLKEAVKQLESSFTFKVVLSALQSLGSFLNDKEPAPFRLDYLTKVSEVKDPRKKQPLTFYLATIVNDNYPNSGDLYGELGALVRAAKVDWEALCSSLKQMLEQCKASDESMRKLENADPPLPPKFPEFIEDVKQRTIMLTLIKHKIFNRYQKMLVWLGWSPLQAASCYPGEVLCWIADFALEYRTARERVLVAKSNPETPTSTLNSTKPRKKSEDLSIDSFKNLILNDDSSRPKMYRRRSMQNFHNSKETDEALQMLLLQEPEKSFRCNRIQKKC